MKRFLIVLVLVGVVIWSSQFQVLADHIENDEFIWEEYRGGTAQNFVTDAELCSEGSILNVYSMSDVEEIMVEKNIIVLPETGRACFVDAIAKFADGTYANIANCAEWKSSNSEVVSAYEGHLIAGIEGVAVVTISYQGVDREILVQVQETVDVAERIKEVLMEENENVLLSMTSSQRDSAVSIAKGMVEMSWMPTQDLIGWKGKVFPANVWVTGMPYSQTAYQKDQKGFLESMGYSDFYTTYVSGDRLMPRYGNDCSGFVSFAWEISRNTTQGFLKGISNGSYSTVGATHYKIMQDGNGLYRIYNYDDVLMKEAFGSISRGDALIQYGHMFLVAANSYSAKVVYVYEQTPQRAVYTSYTYDELAKDNFVPFSK